jgi:hypothetical protein
MKTVDGKIYIFSGASRTGKSAKAVQLMESLKAKTVFVWDIEAQWCDLKGFKRVNTLSQLKKIALSGKPGRYAFVSEGIDIKADFDLFCACVFCYAQDFGECVCVAEELADVTTVSKAPQWWGMLNRRGLKRGLSIIAISQRWQEADKTALGNATEMYIFSPSSYDDAAYISRKISQSASDVMKLPQFTYMRWVKFKGVSVEKLTFKK